MKKWFSKMKLSNSMLLLLLGAIIATLISVYPTEAQEPLPPYPSPYPTPYRATKVQTYEKHYSITEDGLEDGMCKITVPVEKFSKFHSFCTDEVPVMNDSQGEALLIFLPPGCLTVQVIQEEGKQVEFVVHKDNKCWIEFRNMKGKKEVYRGA